MTIRKYLFQTFLALCCTLVGCLSAHDVPVPDTEREATLTLRLSPEAMTRSGDGTVQESAVHDLSLYFFHKTMPEASERLYLENPGGRVSLSLPPGDYELFALANTGGDPGELTAERLAAYTLLLRNDEELAQFVETDRILYGSGLIGTELAGPGVCVSKPEKGIQMHFGAVRNNPKADAAGKALEACFRAGGCNASFDEDVRPYIWKKVIANSGYNGVSAVMRLKVKETFADPYGHDIVMHVWKEGCAVAQALGIGDLWPLMEKEEPNIVANLGNYYPSMAQDAVLHQRQTEISVLNGAIARYGARLGVPTPFNTVITQVISCIQNNYDKQYLG